MTDTWNLKKMIQMNLRGRNRLTDFKNKLMVMKGVKWGRDKLGVWDSHLHTSIYKIDNQQGLNCIAQRTLLSILK